MADSDGFVRPTPRQRKALEAAMAAINKLPEDERYEVQIAVSKGGQFRLSRWDDNDE